jgi:O-antigen/teichoic acid export membrane protein
MNSQRLFRNIGTTLVTQIVVLVATMFSSVFISRALLPTGKGIITFYITLITTISTVASLGISKGFIYEIAQTHQDKNVIRNATTAAILDSIFATLCAAIIIGLRISDYFDKIEGVTLFFALVTVWATGLMGSGGAILRGMDLIPLCNLGSIIYQLSYLIIIILLYVTCEITTEMVIIGYSINTIITAIYYFVLILKRVPGWGFDLSISVKFFSYGLKYFGYNLFTILHIRIDVFIIGIFLSKADLGSYSIAVMFAQLLWQLPMSVNFVLFPFIASQTDLSQASVNTAQISRLSTILAIVAGVGLALFAPIAVEVLYGNAFLPAIEPMRYLIPGVISFSIVQVTSAYLIGRNRIKDLTISSSVIVILNVVINLLLIPHWGIRGAALTSSVTYTFNALILAWFVSQEKNVKMVDILIPRWEDLQMMWRSLLKITMRFAHGNSRI